MTEKDFIIWLHGYLEISGAITLGEKELQVIKDHLNTFFKKVTPDRHPTVVPEFPWPLAWPLEFPPVTVEPYVTYCSTKTGTSVEDVRVC